MKPYIANLLNAIVLIAFGTWGYFAGGQASFTALIPAAFGVILLICTPMVKKENKAVAHIVVLLTLLCLIGLIKPLTSQISQGDTMGIVRVGAMILTGIIAKVSFVKSFIDARKAKQS